MKASPPGAIPWTGTRSKGLYVTGAHCPAQSASLSQSPPCPEQNPMRTHCATVPGQSDASWQIRPSRVPPWHCPVVFGPHVPAQSALLRHVVPLRLPPWHALPTGDQGTAPPTRLSESDEQTPEQEYLMSPRSSGSLASVPMTSGCGGTHTRPFGPDRVTKPGAQVHCPFEQ